MRFLHCGDLSKRLLLGLIVGMVFLMHVVVSAQALDEKTVQQLRALKKLCDAGIVSQDICQEKQRALLDLPPTGLTSVETLSETPDDAPVLETGRGFLGVVVEPISAETGAKLRLTTGEGVTVARVLEDSPAEQAGVKPGDIIIELGDQVVRSADLFAELEASLPPGAEVPVKIVRSAGEEIVLNATSIDRRKYPPAQTHTSSLGFSITLPAGWTDFRRTDYQPIFKAFTGQLGENPQASKILDYIKRFTRAMDTYTIDDASVSAMHHNVVLPTTPRASQEMCARFTANKSKVANLGIQIHNCGLRTIGRSSIFCMDQDTPPQKKRHCWIKKPSQGNLKLTLTFDKRHAASNISDFEKMMASISFLDQGEADQGEVDQGEANKAEAAP